MSVAESDLIPVVEYSRASTDKAKDLHTVKDQQNQNDKTAARLGCRIVARFSDNDKSAAKDQVIRHDFEAMLRVIRAGQLSDGTPVQGCLVVADDRLIRRAGDYERFIDALTFEDGRVYADANGFKDLYREDVESMGLIGAVISRMEVKKTRRRVRSWHRARAQEGTPPAGHRPFGWKDDRKTLDPAEASLIRKAAERFIAGASMNSIVLDWQTSGAKTPRGSEWTGHGVKRILKNPRLCGWRMIDGDLISDPDGSPVIGQWEPVIASDQWLAVQEIFKRRSGQQIGRNGEALYPLAQDAREHKYLLASILRCGAILPDGTMCNKKLRAGAQTKKGVSSYRYFCHSKAAGGCGGITRRGDKVDEFVSEAALAKLEERAVTARKDIGPWAGQRELNEKEEQMRELRNRFAKRKISNTLFFEEVERLEPEIAQLKADHQRHALTAEQSATDLTDIRRRWYSETDPDRLDLAQKRAYIKQAFIALILHPQGKGPKGFNPDLIELVWRTS